MENQNDIESYWHRSTSKAFSFDDEEEGTTSSYQNNIDKWDVAGSSVASAGILSDDTISEASFDSSALAGALNLSIKSIVNDETLQIILKEQTLDDRESYISKGVSPEEELKYLRRQIQTLLYHPSAEVSAYKLLLGKNVALDVFKSLQEKEQLLDTILQYGAGDALIYVVLFLQRTLNRRQFQQVLLARPKALRHFISYLKQNEQMQVACELLKLSNKAQEASLIQFNDALATKDSRKLTELIKNYTIDTHMSIVPLYQQIFEAALKLNEFIQMNKQILGNAVHINSTPLEILYAASAKHTNWKEIDLNKSCSPFRLAAEQQIAPALFEWTVLNERAHAQAYADLESVFERSSSWYPIKQKKFHISFSLETAIYRLYQLKAPNTVLYIFFTHMNNDSDKLNLAKSVKCTKAVIDALVGLKDVNQLSEVYKTLTERSEEQFYCEKALKGLQNKRWSTDNIKLKL